MSVYAQSNRDAVLVTVADTGVGIAAEEQQRIFEPGYRSASARASDVHGTGLGLSIVRDIVQRHGGDIELASALGRGTTVTLSLAAAPAPASPPEELHA